MIKITKIAEIVDDNEPNIRFQLSQYVGQTFINMVTASLEEARALKVALNNREDL